MSAWFRPLRPLLMRLPAPLLDGRSLLFGVCAFYAWLFGLYFLLGIYQPGSAPDASALLARPALTAAGVAAALALAVLYGAWRAAPRLRRPGTVFAVTLLLWALVGAGLQRLILAGELSRAGVLFSLPAWVLLVWVAVAAQRRAALFSRLVQRVEAAVRWVDARVSLTWVVAGIGVLWTLQLVAAELNRYLRLRLLLDTARFEQMLYHTLHGRIGFESLDMINHLGRHFTPSLGLLLPVYAAVPGVTTAVVSQSVLLGAAAIPVWFLARRVTGSRRAAYAFALAYLFFPHVQGLNVNGFRAMGLWPLLGFTYLWLLETPGFWRRWWFWVALALALGVKENIPPAVAFISLAYFVVGRERRVHLAIMATATAWFLATTQVYMPWLLGRDGWVYGWRFIGLLPEEGRSMLVYALNALLHPALAWQYALRPDVLRFLLAISLPLLFLPWFSGLYLIALVPSLLLTNVLGTAEGFQSLLTKNLAYVVPWFLCGMHGWSRVRPWLERRSALAPRGMLYAMVLAAVLVLSQYDQPWRPVEPRHTTVRRFLESVPQSWRVMATECFIPVMATREIVTELRLPRIREVDLVVGQVGQHLCEWSEPVPFSRVEAAVQASGAFVRVPTPHEHLVAYRRIATTHPLGPGGDPTAR